MIFYTFPSYRDVEETDPLGSDDEADKIYKEEPEEAEDLSDKIEKVLFHRVGPKWRKSQQSPAYDGSVLTIRTIYY